MTERRPFLEDGSASGISRTAFRRMRKAQKLELMIDWFGQNYEDPAERTPYDSAEGGYLWIWGGPHDARDVLYTKFGSLVSEGLIDEAAQEIEAEGTVDWASKPTREDYDETAPPDEPIALDVFLDEPSAEYGTLAERSARAEARAAVEQLRAALDQVRPIGIGHNRPPASESEAAEDEGANLDELRRAAAELSAELSKSKPTIAFVKRWVAPLRNAIIATATWGAKKLDKAMDAAMTTAGSIVGGGAVAWLANLDPSLHHAFGAVVQWLEIAAKSIF
ncbi:hypothetical protein ACIDI_103c00010 [Acidiphilium sp. JA12-A1]|nr:hypothetical protein ACIDI_103c00010 [Acidiphilium sp. JA12-A1]